MSFDEFQNNARLYVIGALEPQETEEFEDARKKFGQRADDFIAQLKPKEQMAIVAFHSSADLIQDFTSSKQLLARAVTSVTYGNTPRVLDALYAAIDTGMKNATFRRVALLLTTGYEGERRAAAGTS